MRSASVWMHVIFRFLFGLCSYYNINSYYYHVSLCVVLLCISPLMLFMNSFMHDVDEHDVTCDYVAGLCLRCIISQVDHRPEFGIQTH